MPHSIQGRSDRMTRTRARKLERGADPAACLERLESGASPADCLDQLESGPLKQSAALLRAMARTRDSGAKSSIVRDGLTRIAAFPAVSPPGVAWAALHGLSSGTREAAADRALGWLARAQPDSLAPALVGQGAWGLEVLNGDPVSPAARTSKVEKGWLDRLGDNACRAVAQKMLSDAGQPSPLLAQACRLGADAPTLRAGLAALDAGELKVGGEMLSWCADELVLPLGQLLAPHLPPVWVARQERLLGACHTKEERFDVLRIVALMAARDETMARLTASLNEISESVASELVELWREDKPEISRWLGWSQRLGFSSREALGLVQAIEEGEEPSEALLAALDTDEHLPGCAAVLQEELSRSPTPFLRLLEAVGPSAATATMALTQASPSLESILPHLEEEALERALPHLLALADTPLQASQLRMIDRLRAEESYQPEQARDRSLASLERLGQGMSEFVTGLLDPASDPIQALDFSLGEAAAHSSREGHSDRAETFSFLQDLSRSLAGSTLREVLPAAMKSLDTPWMELAVTLAQSHRDGLAILRVALGRLEGPEARLLESLCSWDDVEPAQRVNAVSEWLSEQPTRPRPLTQVADGARTHLGEALDQQRLARLCFAALSAHGASPLDRAVYAALGELAATRLGSNEERQRLSQILLGSDTHSCEPDPAMLGKVGAELLRALAPESLPLVLPALLGGMEGIAKAGDLKVIDERVSRVRAALERTPDEARAELAGLCQLVGQLSRDLLRLADASTPVQAVRETANRVVLGGVTLPKRAPSRPG